MSMRLVRLVLFVALGAVRVAAGGEIFRAQGELCGEVTTTSAILQTRLTQSEGLNASGDVAGAVGAVRFEISTSAAFNHSLVTEWQTTSAESDFIARVRISDLRPATRYFYRTHVGETPLTAEPGETREFQTLAGADLNRHVRFCVGSCMLYSRFMNGPPLKNEELLPGDQRERGYPSFEAMRRLAPHFFVGTGDIVYYDNPNTKQAPAAKTLEELRKKWHEQFRFPRLVDFFSMTPAYWSKDDHDFRFNDSDLLGDKLPLPATGIDLFYEQLPIAAAAGAARTPMYRTHRISQHLQIWLTEGRDYRSPMKMEDGPQKTLWGVEQREWLQRTLKASDATWKILINPTPMVGPDDAYKKDNHTNLGGYRHEADEFFAWLRDERISGFLTVCGDRHWQFHSIHPSGVQEFGVGALNDENSRRGRSPGDPKSTDPDAQIQQPWTYDKPSGGFLYVTSGADGNLEIQFRNDEGALQHSVQLGN